ncbi:MAG TPA: GGDEF domain-containing phosphodiesterase [Burkholderiales bacterium]
MTAALDSAAIQHLLGQFGLAADSIAALDGLGAALNARAPEALQAARGESALASATSPFFMPLLPAGMSEPQRALVAALARGALGGEALPRLLLAWAQTLNPEEPSERALRDCRPLQELLRAGALRVYAGESALCDAALAAAERLGAVQLALIAEVAARGGHGRGDAASGLAEFMAQADACVAARLADGGQMALLFVDCGVIGRIDGVWGYVVGDGVRNRLGARLRTEVLRAQDILGHPGRDEFACVLASLQSSGVATLAAEKLLRALDQPLWVDVDEVYARPAVGIAVFPEHGTSAVELLQRARTASRAARERPERYALYSADQERSEVELLLYENRLRAAIAQDALDIVFQAQRDARTGLIVGAESQLRWRDASLGAVPVAKAIAAAESAGLVNEVTLWLVNGALRNCRQFRDAAGLDLRVGVTLSAKSLRQADLPDFVLSALKTWNLRPSRLSLEITETQVLATSLESVETLQRLREAGVRLSLDDPGAGYASLAWLATLPFHELRVDLADIGDIVDSPQHLALVRALVELAHRLKMEVLVAGVENEESVARLKPLGCDLIQGAVIGKPLETLEFIRKFRAD